MQYACPRAPIAQTAQPAHNARLRASIRCLSSILMPYPYPYSLWVEGQQPAPKDVSCVYFLIASNCRILYIGETSNLAGRFSGHHRYHEAMKIDPSTRVYVHEWPLPAEGPERVACILARKDSEADCIIRFDPVLQCYGRSWAGKPASRDWNTRRVH